MITTQTWVENNALGNKIGSNITTWYESSPNTWEKKRADIWCNIYGVFRDNDCIQQATNSGIKDDFLNFNIGLTYRFGKFKFKSYGV